MLNLYIDEDNVLRVEGRICHVLLPYAAKHQINLPSKHHGVYLLILEEHKNHRHCGKEYSLSILQQKYWIIKGQSFIRKVIYYLYCKRRAAVPPTSIMEDLPSHYVWLYRHHRSLTLVLISLVL